MARWRLGARLRQQDWAAVAIDLAIVVVGVFLGIQASNWNDDRKDRHIARGYLNRIADDLAYDLRGLRYREDYWRDSADAGDRALRFAEEGQLDRDEWTTLLDFSRAGQIWNYSPSDGTYREMVSAGRLDLLRDSRLKAGLSAYYVGRRTQAHDLFDTLPAYRDDVRGAIPYRFQRYILAHCETGVVASYRGKECPPPSDTSGLADVNRALASNARLIGELRSWMTTLHYIRGVGIENQNFVARLIDQIKNERS